ncbi:glycosyltransferase family 39 protein [Saccharopolyspora sp. K220]|uniref:ArnT family glycosyltransferase n=1 Tax=Saccharopolyspora soli TaxID=2926618 RepID=UPI001F587DF7|nr:glycosyltransferase family 39 protein [Saccharopolyspora soli]MCI2418182.1 glycosyltransferase family 39 protein [Saccharopolyspora soli]
MKTMSQQEKSIRHESSRAPRALVGFAKGPLLLIFAAVVLVLLATSGRYGYFADELYALAAGRRLDWGYADQPPLVPLLAVAMDTLLPGSVVALRIPAALVTGAGVFVVALLAREFGGDRRAQALAAGAWAVTVQFVSAGHMLVTWAFDPFLWAVITWLLVRWTRLHHEGRAADGLLLWAGVVTAVALQVKFLIPAFWACAVLAVVATGPRELLRRPMLWCGAATALITTVPTLVWQHTHGWPQLRMPTAIAAENWYGWLFVPLAVTCAGAVGAVLVCYGLWHLLSAPELRAYRYLGWTALGVTAVFFLAEGRPYYVAGLYGLLYAVASVGLQRRREAGARQRWVAWPAFGASACLALAALPILPASAISPHDVFSRGSVGWPKITAIVADTYHRLPSDRQRTTAVLTHDYWSAAALDRYGPEFGVPRPYSGSRGFWYLGQPPDDAEQVVYLGGNERYLRAFFHEVRLATTVHSGLEVETYYEGTPVWLAAGPKQPWPRLWPQLRRFGIFDGSTGSGNDVPGGDGARHLAMSPDRANAVGGSHDRVMTGVAGYRPVVPWCDR